MEVTEIRAVVRALDGTDAIVEVMGGGCGRCLEPGGCGGQQLTQMLCSSAKTYRVGNAIDAKVGDAVTVGIPAAAVRLSANLAYGLPLIGVIGGALLGSPIAGEPGAVAGAGGGLVLAWLAMRWRGRQTLENANLRPQLMSNRSTQD